MTAPFTFLCLNPRSFRHRPRQTLQALALVEKCPSNRTVFRDQETVLADRESPHSETVFHRQPLAPREVTREHQRGTVGRRPQQQQQPQQQMQAENGKDEDACVLYGDGSEPR